MRLFEPRLTRRVSDAERGEGATAPSSGEDESVLSTFNHQLSTRRPAGRRGGGAMFKLLVFLAVLFATAALAWMLFLPLVVIRQIRQRTGFDATVQSLAVNPFTGTVELRGLVVTNPPTYPVHDFITVRRLSADVEMLSLLGDRPVIATAVLDVAKVTLVRREANQTNAAAFQQRLTIGEEAPLPLRARGVLVRRLSVNLDELVIADHSGRVPAVQDYKIAFKHDYTDVSDTKQLLAPAALQSLLPAGPILRELIPGRLGEAVKDAVQAGTKLMERAGAHSGERSKGYFDALEESKKP